MFSTIQELAKKDPFCAVTLGTAAIIIILILIMWHARFDPVKNENSQAVVKPKTLIIFCSDPRFQAEFGKFVRNKLDLRNGEFVPILVGGGPAALANTSTRCYDFKFLKGQIEFFLGHFPTLENIVLAGHEDCGYYHEVLKLPGQEEKDLVAAQKTVATFCSKPVLLYYARFASPDKKEIVFDPV
jgi:hypothetical protein